MLTDEGGSRVTAVGASVADGAAFLSFAAKKSFQNDGQVAVADQGAGQLE